MTCWPPRAALWSSLTLLLACSNSQPKATSNVEPSPKPGQAPRRNGVELDGVLVWPRPFEPDHPLALLHADAQELIGRVAPTEFEALDVWTKTYTTDSRRLVEMATLVDRDSDSSVFIGFVLGAVHTHLYEAVERARPLATSPENERELLVGIAVAAEHAFEKCAKAGTGVTDALADTVAVCVRRQAAAHAWATRDVPLTPPGVK